MHERKADLLERMRNVELLFMRLNEEAFTYFNNGKAPPFEIDIDLTPRKFYSFVLDMANAQFDVEPEVKCPSFTIEGVTF